MTATRSNGSRWAVAVGLLVAAGACIAAMNWYSIWMSFAHLDVDSGRGAMSIVTLEAQANFQRWVLVVLIALVVSAAAMASEWRRRPNAGTSDRGFVQGDASMHPTNRATSD